MFTRDLVTKSLIFNAKAIPNRLSIEDWLCAFSSLKSYFCDLHQVTQTPPWNQGLTVYSYNTDSNVGNINVMTIRLHIIWMVWVLTPSWLK